MKKVTKEEFYNFINPLNVALTVIGEFPFTTHFKLKTGELKGIVKDNYHDGKYHPIISEYYILS